MAFTQAILKQCWPRWQQHFSPETRLRLGAVPLAVLADCPSDVVGRYLSAAELEQWSGFHLKKRRTEWLGGRLSAKWAAAGLLNKAEMDWHSLVIQSEEDGRPYLAAGVRPVAPFISISHSGHLAAALAANLPCGLDIQQPDAKMHTVKKRFATPEEEDLLTAALPQSFTKTEQLTLLWAAKEAVRKMVRISPLLGLLDIRLLAGHGGRSTPQEPLALTFTASRQQECQTNISVLCFFTDNLAWAMACPMLIKLS